MAVYPELTIRRPGLGRPTRRLDDAARQLAELPLAGPHDIQLLYLDYEKLYYVPVDPARDLSALRREQLQAMLSAALGFKVRLVKAEEA